MAIVRVQTPAMVAFLTSSATTTASTFASPVTAGSLLVAFLGCTSATAQSFASTGAPTWVKIAQFTDTGGSTVTMSIGYCLNAPAGTTTVTATHGSTGIRALCIAEYSGVLTSAALDKNTTGLTTAATATPTDTSMTTTTDGQLIVSALTFRNATSPASVGAGYTEIQIDQASEVGVDFGAEDRIQVAAGAIAPTWTLNSASAASAIMSATFKATVTAVGLPILVTAPPR